MFSEMVSHNPVAPIAREEMFLKGLDTGQVCTSEGGLGGCATHP